MPKIIEPGKVQAEGDDSYSSLAHHLCGVGSKWPEFLKVNPNLRREPLSPVQVGMVLNIPPEWPVQTAEDLKLPPQARSLVTRDAGGRATVAGPEVRYPNPEPAAYGGLVTREEYEKLGSVVRSLAEWIQTADEQIGKQEDEIAILKAQRESDQQRLAEQGAKISVLEAKLAGAPTQPAPAPDQTAAPAVPTVPNVTL